MSDVEGTRTNPTFTDTIKVPNGVATVMADRISRSSAQSVGITFAQAIDRTCTVGPANKRLPLIVNTAF